MPSEIGTEISIHSWDEATLCFLFRPVVVEGGSGMATKSYTIILGATNGVIQLMNLGLKQSYYFQGNDIRGEVLSVYYDVGFLVERGAFLEQLFSGL